MVEPVEPPRVESPRVELHRAYRFRLYPSRVQEAELSEWLRQLRWLYNLAHEQRLASLSRTHPLSMGKGFCRGCGAVIPKKKDGEEEEEEEDTGEGSKKKKRTVEHTAACAWVDYFRQGREMTALMRSDPQLERVVCCARQEVLRDLDRAWQRWRKGLGGRPRFKRRTEFPHLYLATPKHWQVIPGFLLLKGSASSVGPISIRQDRPWPKDAKFSSCHVMRDVDEWYAVFQLTFSVEAAPAASRSVGINRGALHALADSDGRVVDSPRFYLRGLRGIQLRGRAHSRTVKRGTVPKAPEPRRSAAEEIKALATRFATSTGNVLYQIKKRGGLEQAIAYLEAHAPKPLSTEAAPVSQGRNRQRALEHLQRAHRTIRRQREWFLHEQSAYYAKRYALIGIEDWSTREMTAAKAEPDARIRGAAKHALNRSILDVGWYELARQIKYKGEATNSRLVAVDPGIFEGDGLSISNICSVCGAPLVRSASGRVMAHCTRCSHVELGDINAARNVRRRAEAAPPPAPKKPKVTIKIKGRAKAQPATPEKPSDEASGGDPSVRGPVETGTLDP